MDSTNAEAGDVYLPSDEDVRVNAAAEEPAGPTPLLPDDLEPLSDGESDISQSGTLETGAGGAMDTESRETQAEQAEPAARPVLADGVPTSIAAPGLDQSDALADVRETLQRIQDTMAESYRLIDRQTEVSATLHAENQTLRAGELRKAQTSLVLSVVRVYDDVSRMAATTAEPAAARDLALVAETLTDALERNGVDLIVVEPGEPFTTARHKLGAVEPVDDETAHRTVVRVTRPGFVWVDGEVVRPAEVVVGKHTPPATDTEQRDAIPVETSQPDPEALRAPSQQS